MGIWTTRRRPDVEPQRAMTMPAVWHEARGTFADASIAGTGARASIAVQASTDMVCSLVSELPVTVFRGAGPDQVEMSVPGNISDPAQDGQGLEDWIYQLVGSWLHRGNAYGDPIEDRLGYLRGLSLHEPDSVAANLDRSTGVVSWTVNGRPTSGLFHSRVNPMAGVLLGFSPVEKNGITILSSIAATRFAHQWFTEGTHPQMLLTNSEAESLTAEQVAVVLARWRAMKTGTREPAVLTKGWKAEGLNITPEQAQLLQLIGASEAQACRIFGPAVAETLGYESGGSMTYSNIVDRRSDLLVLTLNRWIRRVERLLSSMLPAPQKVRLNRDALLESTTLARYEAHAKSLAWKSINEVRDIEDQPPVPWGDGPTTSTPPSLAAGGAAA